MSQNKPQKKPSEKAKESLVALRQRELMESSKETLAEYSAKMEIECENRGKTINRRDIEIERLKKKITELENETNPTCKYDGYNKSNDGVEKIVFILERNKVGMKYEKIKDALLLLEPELKERWGNINMGVSHLLSKACEYKAIVKSKKYGEKGYYIYSLP